MFSTKNEREKWWEHAGQDSEESKTKPPLTRTASSPIQYPSRVKASGGYWLRLEYFAKPV